MVAKGANPEVPAEEVARPKAHGKATEDEAQAIADAVSARNRAHGLPAKAKKV